MIIISKETLDIATDGGAETVTRGAVISAIYRSIATEPALNDGDPWVDYTLRENVNFVQARPDSAKDDLYLYSNYDWMKSAEIKPGFRSENAFSEVADEIREMGMAVLTDTSLAGADAALVQQLYNAYLDWDARNALGVAPVQKTIDEIKAVSTIDELTALFCNTDSDVEQYFNFDADTGMNDSETYLAYAWPMGLILDDSAEYTQRTEMGERYEAAYLAAARKMLPKFGYTEAEAEQMLRRALALEGDLSGGIMTSAEEMAPDYEQRTNNEMDRAGAEKICKVFPMLAIMDAWGYSGAERYLVTQPAFFEKLDEVYTAERLDDLKNYLIVCAALDNMDMLDRDSYEISIEMDNAINGSIGSQPDEEVAFDLVRDYLTTPMDRAFLARYDSTQMKERVTRICEEAVAYYRTMLSEEDWLSEETKQKAIEKLDAITINAVYPDKWRDYSTREAEYYYLMQDTHPLHYLRANATAQQFEQFYETYDVHEGDGMYLAPADRVLVW